MFTLILNYIAAVDVNIHEVKAKHSHSLYLWVFIGYKAIFSSPKIILILKTPTHQINLLPSNFHENSRVL